MVKQEIKPGDFPPDLPAPDTGRVGLSRWLWEEALYHLIPWGPNFLRQKPALVAAGVGFAVLVTATWLLAATGRIGSAAVIGWWIAWSVYEFMCRTRCKPWVKEGPWWKRQYRPATKPDLIAYVATKNLLIGAGLFLVLKLVGALDQGF